jgi:hypothetical protein
VADSCRYRAHDEGNAMTTPLHLLLAVTISVMAARAALGETRIDETALPAGSYAITTRLEVPHLERWAIDKTTTVCLSGQATDGRMPIPVLSDNSPYAACGAANLVIDHGRLEYDVLCPGRGSAKAHAAYSLATDGFAGRVAMVLGGKNMTMTEVQHARRLGDCRSPRRQTATGF